jgi:GR25 family glycosyltransferase involved in LPS biosynthesis
MLAQLIQRKLQATKNFFSTRRKSRTGMILNKIFALFTAPQAFRVIPKKINSAFKLILAGQGKIIWYKIKHITTPAPIIELKDGTPILATQHTLYIAYLIENELTKIGHKAYTSIKYHKEADVGQLHIVICPQIFPQLPKNFVAFQMEQNTLSRWFTEDYFSILNNAINIFDYSINNIDFLTNKGIAYQNIFYMPVGSFPNYLDFLRSKDYKLPSIKKNIDVLFYGDPTSPRRQLYLKELKRKFKVHVASEVFGENMVNLIRSAKIVINIHYAENALLETTRLHEVLSIGVPIVSEESIDIEHYDDLRNVICFAPIDDTQAMIEQITQLLTNADYYNHYQSTISNYVNHDKQFSSYFKRFLLAYDLLEFKDYQHSVDFIPASQEEIPRICLTLTETTARKKHFLSNDTHGFQTMEGVRHRIGWLGCGMSYKYLLTTLQERGARLCMVCEDDVIFPPDFDVKIVKIIKYLNSIQHPWDLFSGLIADLNQDAKVIKIEEHDGIEYIYIDKMTSTVMNIYSPSIIKAISGWDPKNENAQVNTIDRFIESQGNLVTITTSPFLVGHLEDQNSTLWGTPNALYLESIRKSEQLLKDKAAAFKKAH